MMKVLAQITLLPVLILCCCLPAGAVSKQFLAVMESQLSCYPLQLAEPADQEISIAKEDLCIATIYGANGMKPLWVSEAGPGEKAAVILQALENAADEGLQPGDYNVTGIQELWQSERLENLARLDIQLTLNFIKYAHDVSYGKIILFEADPELFAEAGNKHFKPLEEIEKALAAPDIAGYIASLPPGHEYYRGLRKALQFYRDIEAGGKWNRVAEGRTLHPGDRDPRLNQVRQRLARTGELAPAAASGNYYDAHLAKAVMKFQERFGLEIDGIIGPRTLKALNITPAEIIISIIVNMARWRWQEHELGRRYIMVNIANYDLRGVVAGREVLDMAVIVGKYQTQTPVFSHRVQYLEFNPFWNIPPSIARQEELPELRRDPYYLVHRKVRLFSGWEPDAAELDSTTIDWQSVTPEQMEHYKLRQEPGPWNALGQLKLMFPNSYNVYIHGTPAPELFEHNTRNFSHGCIRVSQPLVLAEFALSEEKEPWPLARIQEVVAAGQREVINVTSPLQVHITYQTVWVDKQGIIRFNSDSYGRDGRLAEILFAAADNAATSTSRKAADE